MDRETTHHRLGKRRTSRGAGQEWGNHRYPLPEGKANQSRGPGCESGAGASGGATVIGGRLGTAAPGVAKALSPDPRPS